MGAGVAREKRSVGREGGLEAEGTTDQGGSRGPAPGGLSRATRPDVCVNIGDSFEISVICPSRAVGVEQYQPFPRASFSSRSLRPPFPRLSPNTWLNWTFNPTSDWVSMARGR
jgi:hypothetical protein